MNQTTISIVRGLLCPKFYDRIFKILTFFLLVFALSANRATAQEGGPATGIAVGQAVPDYLWDYSFKSLKVSHGLKGNGFEPAVFKLRELKGRLIILDFWATWCGACIANFPKAKKLESAFLGKLSFVLVNNEPAEKAGLLLSKRILENGESFRYVNSDTLLNSLFFKRLIPHYVWIDGNGKVIAATGPDEVNEKNISLALNGMGTGINNIPNIDRKLPLFSSASLPLGNVLKYNLLVKGKVQGLGSGYEWRRDPSGKVITGRVITNLPLWSIYRKLATERAVKERKRFDLERVVYEGRHNSLLRDTFFNYEFSVSTVLSPKLDSLMLSDLNTFSPFNVSFENRKTKCLALELSGRGKLPQAVPGAIKEITFESVEGRKEKVLKVVNVKPIDLIYLIKENGNIKDAVTDATGIEKGLSLKLFLPDTIPGINRQLEQYGLRIREQSAELEYMVIRDQPVIKVF